MAGLSETIRQFAKQMEIEANAVVVKVTFDLHGRIVARSPVRTGRFKANNQIAIGGLPGNATMAIDPGGAATISDGKATLARFKFGDTIWIYNNVAYALDLEFGSSQQAPAGVYRISVQEVAAALDSIMKGAVR